MTKLQEILNVVLLEMRVNGIEDIPENRILFLIKLRNRWLIEGTKSMIMTNYIGTANMEILRLQIMIEDSARL